MDALGKKAWDTALSHADTIMKYYMLLSAEMQVHDEQCRKLDMPGIMDFCGDDLKKIGEILRANKADLESQCAEIDLLESELNDIFKGE